MAGIARKQDDQYQNTFRGAQMADEEGDKSTWAVGGGLVLGTGVVLFFLQTSALAFAGSILTGLGLGLVLTALIRPKQRR